MLVMYVHTYSHRHSLTHLYREPPTQDRPRPTLHSTPLHLVLLILMSSFRPRLKPDLPTGDVLRTNASIFGPGCLTPSPASGCDCNIYGYSTSLADVLSRQLTLLNHNITSIAAPADWNSSACMPSLLAVCWQGYILYKHILHAWASFLGSLAEAWGQRLRAAKQVLLLTPIVDCDSLGAPVSLDS